MTLREQTLIREARIYAMGAHAGQKRKYTGLPYVTHCEAVALNVYNKGGKASQIAAAWLHDVLEDTATEYTDLIDLFGSEVAYYVQELTDHFTHENYPMFNRALRKWMEANRLGAISDEAKLVKVCDLADNTSSIVGHDPGFASKYLVEKGQTLELMGFSPSEDES